MNWLALIIATLVPTVTGMIYYSKPLLQKQWMDAIGMTDEKMKSANMGVMMGISIIMAFLLATTLTMFNNAPGQEGEFDNFGHGAFHGLMLTVFLVGPVLISKGLFEQHTWKSMIISIVYWGITLALMGGIVDAMNHWPNVAS